MALRFYRDQSIFYDEQCHVYVKETKNWENAVDHFSLVAEIIDDNGVDRRKTRTRRGVNPGRAVRVVTHHMVCEQRRCRSSSARTNVLSPAPLCRGHAVHENCARGGRALRIRAGRFAETRRSDGRLRSRLRRAHSTVSLCPKSLSAVCYGVSSGRAARDRPEETTTTTTKSRRWVSRSGEQTRVTDSFRRARGIRTMHYLSLLFTVLLRNVIAVIVLRQYWRM